jgi:iron complex transport system permease protein
METALHIKLGRTYRHAAILTGMTGLLIALFLISLSIGAVPISVREIINIFLSKIGIGSFQETDVKNLVLLNIRLPRLLFTILIGGSLGIAGASLQGLFRNPLVEPGIIGISSGAALGAVLVIMGGRFIHVEVTQQLGQWLLPVFAFGGGIAATFLTLRLGSYEGETRVTILILAGVGITALAGAAIGLSIFYSDEQQLRTYNFWTLGDLSAGTWDKIFILLPLVLLSVGGLVAISGQLNVLALGEAEAFHSGVNVERLKIIVVLLSALAVSTSVAFAGSIGFIGLVVPHIIRILFSPDHELVLPVSAIGGACLLVLADMFARTIVSPAELPIGIVTAGIGTPFFLYLLMSTKKKKMF